MSRFRRNPSMKELKRKTGKDEGTIRKAVNNLVTREHLTWDKEKKPSIRMTQVSMIIRLHM